MPSVEEMAGRRNVSKLFVKRKTKEEEREEKKRKSTS